MNAIEIIGGIVILIAAVLVIVTVMMQEGKNNGLSALSGGGEGSYLGRNKNRSLQATLARVTRGAGIVFVVVTLAVYFISAALN